MSLNRYNPRRDANEPEIRKRFVHHDWHTEQLSGAGMPDLLAWPWEPPTTERRSIFVDVKDGDGKPTGPQVKKWTNLRVLGIPVYVVRTEADVDALVAGTLEPWGPEPRMPQTIPAIRREEWEAAGERRAPRPHGNTKRACKGDAAKARSSGKARLRTVADAIAERSEKRLVEKGYIGQAVVNYAPPRSTPVDAAKEAEVLAPAATYRCDFCKRERPRPEMLLGADPNDRYRLALRGFNGKANGTPWPTAMCLTDRAACDNANDTP